MRALLLLLGAQGRRRLPAQKGARSLPGMQQPLLEHPQKKQDRPGEAGRPLAGPKGTDGKDGKDGNPGRTGTGNHGPPPRSGGQPERPREKPTPPDGPPTGEGE